MSPSPIHRIAELWRVREFIGALVLSDLRIRYRRSTLGFFWSLLRPLLMVVIFTVVFSVYLRLGVPNYPIFFLSGFLPWLFLSSSLTEAANVLPSHEALVKRARFARLVLPFASVFSNLIHFLLALAVFSPFLLLMGPAPTIRLALLPLAIVLQVILVLGFGTFLAAANVFYRDIGQALDILLMGWMFLSPVIYPARMIPEQFLPLYRLNPMVHLIGLYRSALLGEALPPWSSLAYLLAWALVALAVGLMVFTRFESDFAKEL